MILLTKKEVGGKVVSCSSAPVQNSFNVCLLVDGFLKLFLYNQSLDTDYIVANRKVYCLV